MDLLKNLRHYMTHYPDSFVGFFDAAATILRSVGSEWIAYGKPKYGNVFLEAATQLEEVVIKFKCVQEEFETEQNDPVSLVQDYHQRLTKNIKHNG